MAAQKGYIQIAETVSYCSGFDYSGFGCSGFDCSGFDCSGSNCSSFRRVIERVLERVVERVVKRVPGRVPFNAHPRLRELSARYSSRLLRVPRDHDKAAIYSYRITDAHTA